jgi:hypothetical protein
MRLNRPLPRITRGNSHRTESTTTSPSDAEDSSGAGSGTEDTLQRMINVKNCPLCHRPRLHKKAEMDVITHLLSALVVTGPRSIGS